MRMFHSGNAMLVAGGARHCSPGQRITLLSLYRMGDGVTHARDVVFAEDLPRIVQDPDAVAEMRERIRDGDSYVVRSALPRGLVGRIKAYLSRIGQHSLPNYAKIEPGCPNFHRMNRLDPRADVRGMFHQFVFFPWNQDVFDLFRCFREIYELKNLLSGLPPRSFLGYEPERGCTARLAFQFYPSGGGQLNRHADPVGYHQLVVPTVAMSDRGEDYETGGLFVEREDGTRVDLDADLRMGDAVFFNASIIHGVAPVDPDAECDWLSFRGRWMALVAVNRLHSNEAVGRSQDLDDAP